MHIDAKIDNHLLSLYPVFHKYSELTVNYLNGHCQIYCLSNRTIYIHGKFLVQLKIRCLIIKFFDNVPNLHKIEDIYINLGPGSFTGARIALLYVRTLAQLNNQIKIYTTNTYLLLSSLNKKFLQRKFFIFATKNKSYLLTNKSVKIVNKHAKESQINYDLLLSNFDKFLNTFTLSSTENLQPTYASQPQIGEIKK